MTKHDADRKVRILDFIAATLRARGFPPSVREIAKAVGLASTSAVHHHLQILEREGYLERGAAQSRAIRLTPYAAIRRSTRTGNSQTQAMRPFRGFRRRSFPEIDWRWLQAPY